ncbi:hypothetical protein CTAYLR_000635 [Chrysophaeum taylorii]|uniref:Uncharacterized protein n=1 Tax=Chrysophaeum taylorii TaxID=2483200 RepID=A0AAD7XJ54_9STRA|nr:hypothetical protein CTAYLR_000635 [Chrysophaeum taylorii]
MKVLIILWWVKATGSSSDDDCVAIVDGSRSNDRADESCAHAPLPDTDPPILYVHRELDVAGVRCCDDHGWAESVCESRCEAVNFTVAEARCSDLGAWLCSLDNIWDGSGIGTGCGYDFMHVWTSTLGSCPEPPTQRPMQKPIPRPTAKPSEPVPSQKPTQKPIPRPTAKPSEPVPSQKPTQNPTTRPTAKPSAGPSPKPTYEPSYEPSYQPTRHPTRAPTRRPTERPTRQPTADPSGHSALERNDPTRRPTTTSSPTLDCVAIVDGKPEEAPSREDVCVLLSDVGKPDVLYARAVDGVAGVRCCSTDNVSARVAKSFCDSACELVPFATAVVRCQANGMRLCSQAEVLDGVTVNTGCSYDFTYVWTSTAVACPAETTTSAPTTMPSSSRKNLALGEPTTFTPSSQATVRHLFASPSAAAARDSRSPTSEQTATTSFGASSAFALTGVSAAGVQEDEIRVLGHAILEAVPLVVAIEAAEAADAANATRVDFACRVVANAAAAALIEALAAAIESGDLQSLLVGRGTRLDNASLDVERSLFLVRTETRLGVSTYAPSAAGTQDRRDGSSNRRFIQSARRVAAIVVVTVVAAALMTCARAARGRRRSHCRRPSVVNAVPLARAEVLCSTNDDERKEDGFAPPSSAPTNDCDSLFAIAPHEDFAYHDLVVRLFREASSILLTTDDDDESEKPLPSSSSSEKKENSPPTAVEIE